MEQLQSSERGPGPRYLSSTIQNNLGTWEKVKEVEEVVWALQKKEDTVLQVVEVKGAEIYTSATLLIETPSLIVMVDRLGWDFNMWYFDSFYIYAYAYIRASLIVQLVKNLLQCRRPRFNSWVGKILWRRKWQPTPVFLPRESHGQRSLVRYSPRGRKESDTTGWLHFLFT